MLDKTKPTTVGPVVKTVEQGHGPDHKSYETVYPNHDHDPYENVDPNIVTVLEKLRELLTQTEHFPGGVPFKLEVTSGVARERLTLGAGFDEVFMIKKKDRPVDAPARRTLVIDIMSEADAKAEIEGSGSSSVGAPAVIDPCCWWEWDGTRWVCVGYGD